MCLWNFETRRQPKNKLEKHDANINVTRYKIKIIRKFKNCNAHKHFTIQQKDFKLWQEFPNNTTQMKDTTKCKNKRTKWTWTPNLLYGVWNQNWKGKRQNVWTSTSADMNLEEEQKLKGV
jgi:hypothetical protein